MAGAPNEGDGRPSGGLAVDIAGAFGRDCTLATPPDFYPVGVDAIKAYLKVSSDSEDDLFELWAATAASVVTGATDHQLAEASYTAYFDVFASRMWLPLVPLLSVSAVEYRDADGEWQTADADLYEVVTRGQRFGYVRSAEGASWPTPGRWDRAVRVTFTAGYEDAESVPAAARQAVCMLAGHWYLRREAASEERLAEIPLALTAWYDTLRAKW